MKKQAEDLAKQMGAQIKITIFNLDSRKTITYHTSSVTEEKEPGNNIAIDACDDVLEKQPPLIHSPFKGLKLPLLINFHSEKGEECSLAGAAALSPVINNLPRSSSTSSSKKKKVCRASTGKRPPGKLILRKEKQCENKERPGSPSKLIPKKIHLQRNHENFDAGTRPCRNTSEKTKTKFTGLFRLFRSI